MNEFNDNRGDPRSLSRNLDQVYLRLSLTDACNFRCQYCMPAEGYPRQQNRSMASDDELIRLVELVSSVRPLHKIRLTGGEPLLRKSIVSIADRLASRFPDAKLRLTTNGVLLPRYADRLFQAGVDTVNVSLDSLDAGEFERLARRNNLPETLAGIDAALEAGMRVKLNTVLIKSSISKGVGDLVRFASERNLEIRFIELMPLGEGTKLYPAEFISAEDTLSILEKDWRYQHEQGRGATSDRHQLQSTLDGKPVTVGFIRTMSKPFCGDCDRLRLDSRGQLFTCLRSVFGRPLLGLLREGNEEAVQRKVLEAVHGKIIPEGAWPEYRSMVAIGG